LKPKFILLGDSLTFGYGVPSKNSWANIISQKVNIQIINKGINGDTTPSMLSRFYTDVSSLNPDYVFIMGGTNDLLCGRSVSSIIDNIELMIKDSKNSTVFIGIPPCIIEEMAQKLFMPSTLYKYCSSNLPNLREELIKLCKKYSINYIDFYSLTKNNLDKSIFLDGIHLNSLGNILMSEEILKSIDL